MEPLGVEFVLAEFALRIGAEPHLDELDAIRIVHAECFGDFGGRVTLAGAGHAVVHF